MENTKTKSILLEQLEQNGMNGIHTKDGHCVALTFDEGGEMDRKANAQEIVKRWNLHYEAMNIIISFLRDSSFAQREKELIKKAVDLLNRSKE